MQTTYDALSRPHQVMLPDNEVLTYSYGTNGLLSGLASSLGATYVSGVVYNALNQPSQYDLGGSSSGRVSHTYHGIDYQTVMYPYGALRRTLWPSGGGLVDRTLSYWEAGNVRQIEDGVHGETIDYTYDDLDRLESASAPVSEIYEYDAIGNITHKTVGDTRKSYSYDSAHIHAVTLFDGTAYLYDANGSLMERGGWRIRYDPERRPLRVDDDAGRVVWRAAYDANGVRRKRLDANGTIHYAGSYERNVGNAQDTTETITKYYRALGRLIAFRKNGTLYYVGTDHLGGTIRVANASFEPVAQRRYTPYGVNRDPTSDLRTDYGFTSQVEDRSVGLYWYASRAYDPTIGRFVVADSIVPEPGNPQALNRYTYCANDPMKYEDPDGHVFVLAPFLIAAGIGAGVGIAAGMAGYVLSQQMMGKPVDGGELAIAAVSGAVGGAAAAAGPVAAIVFGGVAGCGQYAATEVYNERMPSLDKAAISTALGAIGGKISGAFETSFEPFARNLFEAAMGRFSGYVSPGLERWIVGEARTSIFQQAMGSLFRSAAVNAFGSMATGWWDQMVGPIQPQGGPQFSQLSLQVLGLGGSLQLLGDSGDWSASIPAGQAPGGVGVVNITPSNPSGSPAGGGNWASPGGGDATSDAEARRAAWQRGGSTDYNAMRNAGVPGF